MIGGRGNGMRVALGTLDVFRPSVGAAALGLARRAFAKSLARTQSRPMFGGKLGDLQLVQAKLADMALKIDAAALLVYRAAWAKDVAGASRITREAAMASCSPPKRRKRSSTMRCSLGRGGCRDRRRGGSALSGYPRHASL